MTPEENDLYHTAVGKYRYGIVARQKMGVYDKMLGNYAPLFQGLRYVAQTKYWNPNPKFFDSIIFDIVMEKHNPQTIAQISSYYNRYHNVIVGGEHNLDVTKYYDYMATNARRKLRDAFKRHVEAYPTTENRIRGKL